MNPPHIHTYADTQNPTTPFRTHTYPTHTPQPRTHRDQRTPGRHWESTRERDPEPETSYTPYRRPFGSSFSSSGLKKKTALLPTPTLDNPRPDHHPALLSPPNLGNPRPDKHPNGQLGDIYATLNALVSRVKSSIKSIDEQPECVPDLASPYAFSLYMYLPQPLMNPVPLHICSLCPQLTVVDL